MSGHSHWAGIKHKKALVDAKRGKLWSKLAKAIIIAAKLGGGDPDANIRLRAAIDEAKAVSLPKENIARAIKRGSGELGSEQLDELIYEGYGPGGVAVLAEAVTDNRNRTSPEIKKIFEVCGGKLGTTGCVAWNFEKKGFFVIPKNVPKKGALTEEVVMELALEAGADDVRETDDGFEITCSPESYESVSNALQKAGIEPEESQLSLIPKDTAEISDTETAVRILKLMELLDDHDDIQKVSSNFNIPEEIMNQLNIG
ncbi:MAG: YebC/PmpR family DNA-binding transcriptional regulator [Planctomycetaceae bacterium]|jgi:YebC/PmpR family DNA-binding regulatory protein|nr:YebC/PmpR family DNA-binding transcriptional regulator [Planctomycetaceae bacterium]